MFLRLIFDICFSLCYICNVIDYKKFFMKKVTHMSDEAFLFEEIEEIVAPTDGEFLGEFYLELG